MSNHAADQGTSTSRSGTNLVVVVLLAGILLALVILIAMLATQKIEGSDRGTPTKGSTSSDPVVADSQEVRREELASPPKSPVPLDDPRRIKETLRAGKTYSVVVKAGLEARAEDKAWWRKEVIHLAYLAEMQVDRTIESNDGRRIVELRHFVTSRNAKLLCNVEDVTIDLGPPGTLVLGALSYLKPEAGIALTLAKPVAEAILRRGAQDAARSEAPYRLAQARDVGPIRSRVRPRGPRESVRYLRQWREGPYRNGAAGGSGAVRGDGYLPGRAGRLAARNRGRGTGSPRFRAGNLARRKKRLRN